MLILFDLIRQSGKGTTGGNQLHMCDIFLHDTPAVFGAVGDPNELLALGQQLYTFFRQAFGCYG